MIFSFIVEFYRRSVFRYHCSAVLATVCFYHNAQIDTLWQHNERNKIESLSFSIFIYDYFDKSLCNLSHEFHFAKPTFMTCTCWPPFAVHWFLRFISSAAASSSFANKNVALINKQIHTHIISSIIHSNWRSEGFFHQKRFSLYVFKYNHTGGCFRRSNSNWMSKQTNKNTHTHIVK